MTEQIAIQMIPKTSPCPELEEFLSSEQWASIAQKSMTQAHGTCQVCNQSSADLRPTAFWHFDDEQGLQSLVGVKAVCNGCWLCTQLTKEAGRQQVGIALAHLQEINGWSRNQAAQHLTDSVVTLQRRASRQWELDLVWLGNPRAENSEARRPAIREEKEDRKDVTNEEENDEEGSGGPPFELASNQIALKVPDLDEWMDSLYELEASKVGNATKGILQRALDAGLPRQEVGGFLKELANEGREIRRALREQVPPRTVKQADGEAEFPPPDEALAMLWESKNGGPGPAWASCEQRWASLPPDLLEWARDRVTKRALEAAESARDVWATVNGDDVWVIEVVPDADPS